ncbi:3-phosphoshikimate 1-carboxyvinyltransferase [Sphingobacterium psychroaquaticum]|uniref:3-phosphoshikimate 1-carboxyvinyltransferase n=1 Tax=Sphingobacterium psychroaquaticum TaxID=561061 RepID=UPI00106CA94E|nr:3-phosphoshikimate 1-carboxyvinyltransferase [Sphingobacterium psychroaquaticum]QBQ42264.1 3-phosphoshikimate 1-carboxyvinyltransferase [Sphingobacterium psychroaquaticum]
MSLKSISLTHPTKAISGTVQLTGSKSESNRALILEALSQGLVRIENLSAAADTVIMQQALQQAQDTQATHKTIDIGPAGTAMRFLTSYLNLANGSFTLTGTERMQQRPIGILVDALRSIGADITYEKAEGYPPLRIVGGFQQTADNLRIKGDVSSQYLSSLLLVAATLEQGLTLNIEGELTSKPYVSMTLDMLQEAGIKHHWSENSVAIAKQPFLETTIYIEPDWSAASYWYSIVALSDNGHIILPGLKRNSLQGDIAIADIMQHFGVESRFEIDGLHLIKTDNISTEKLFDFKECPDLAQTVVALAAGLKRDISITGVETLKIKETDRIAALRQEISKFGAELITDGDIYHLHTAGVALSEPLTFDTYEDHRMAMAFAPLALIFNNITINEPMVVEKSYPLFWEHLKSQGFKIVE